MEYDDRQYGYDHRYSDTDYPSSPTLVGESQSKRSTGPGLINQGLQSYDDLVRMRPSLLNKVMGTNVLLPDVSTYLDFETR